jgi:hypothetical protein
VLETPSSDLWLCHPRRIQTSPSIALYKAGGLNDAFKLEGVTVFVPVTLAVEQP